MEDFKVSKLKSFMAKAKKAPKKNLAMAIGCLVGAIALTVYFITLFI